MTKMSSEELERVRAIRVDDLDLTVRSKNVLHDLSFKTVGEVLDYGGSRLLRARRCGRRTLQNIAETLGALGVDLPYESGENTLTEVQSLISSECESIKALLLQKNREYGNSALEPINVFSSLTAEEQIKVRIDDKLKRIQTTKLLSKVTIIEDTEMDLIGYLILLRVCRRLK